MYEGTLGTRGPWEALVTFQQLLVLADRYGVVDMTSEVISRRTLIPHDIILKGIEHLLQPDPNSRRKEHNGCRIVPFDVDRNWGWRIVNFDYYRNLQRHQDRRDYHANYMRDYREGKKRSHAYTENFLRFWQAYPRKIGKGAAWRSWQRIDPDNDTQIKIFRALTEQIPSAQWTKEQGRFVPHPATWLNQSRWEDEQTQLAKRDIVV